MPEDAPRDAPSDTDAAAPQHGRRRVLRRARGVGGVLLGQAAALSAAISVIAALVSVYEATRAPDVYFSLVPRIRLAANAGDPRRYFYIQPILAIQSANDKTAFITNLTAEVRPMAGGTVAPFSWTSVSRLDYDPKTAEEIPIFVSDPVPMLVSPSSPQTPFLLFSGPPGWSFRGGASYCVVLTADRLGSSRPLRAALRVSVDPATWQETVNATPGTERRYDAALVNPTTCR